MHWWKRRGGKLPEENASAKNTSGKNAAKNSEEENAPRGRRLSSGTVHTKLAINAVGAVTTGAALAIILAAKFVEGAWITVLAIPIMIAAFKAVHRYYDRVEAETRNFRPLELTRIKPPVVLIAAEHWDLLTAKALRFAMSVSEDVVAVHLDTEQPGAEKEETKFHENWRRFVEEPAQLSHARAPRLIAIRSKFRTFVQPLLKYLVDLQNEFPDRQIAIIIPQLVRKHWWEALHNHRALRLRSALLRYGGTHLIVISMPWYLEPPEPPAETEESDRRDQVEVSADAHETKRALDSRPHLRTYLHRHKKH